MDREKLAAYAHEAWSGWVIYVFEKSIRNPDGTVTIPAWAVERRERLAQTPYAKLPKAEKESDLVEADRMLSIITMDRVQEKEVMEYLAKELHPKVHHGDFTRRNFEVLQKIVRAILRRYDLVPRGE